VLFEIIQTQNRRSNNKQKTSPQSYKTQIKIFAYPELAQSGFEQPGPGAPLLGLMKSIYYIQCEETLVTNMIIRVH